MNKEVVSPMRMTDNDERAWRQSHDDLEPLVGVPSFGAAPVPLPDDVGEEPEPGVAAEQEDAEEVVGFESPPDY